MSVLSYLQARASSAVLSSSENASIATSIGALQSRLNGYFIREGDGLSSHFKFGSSTRGTILPRADDSHSDIDYMLVFEKGGFTPQTYLDRLRTFVEKRYSSSEIYQSNPTIVLELNHIKFDLVPALHQWGNNYRIPDRAGAWQDTAPNDFNATLEAANENNSYLVKPTVRLAKIWNAANGYVFDSYAFEKWIAGRLFLFCSNQRDYLFAVFDNLSATEKAQWRNEKITRAKQIVANVRDYEKNLMPASAEAEVKKLIPEG